MASKYSAATVAETVASGDKMFEDGQFYQAAAKYQEAFVIQIQLNNGKVGASDKPLMEKIFDANMAGSFTYPQLMASCLKMARTILFLAEREHGIDSPELIQPLERLVTLYDLDGAHMLAIEVKQRIDDIRAQQQSAV